MAQVETSRFTQLMSSLVRFKTNTFLCDFTVKVGTKSLSAHRNILAASSEYFEALFLSNMKEVQDGFIDMKDVEPNAIELCIEFMYTGEAKITMTTIPDILHSSELLQLSDLTDLCFKELEKNISPQNSLFTIYLAQMYNRHDVKKHAEQTVINNFTAVISTPMFPSISKSELFRYIKASNTSYQTKWKAVIEWINGQEGNTDELFLRLLALLDIQNFPIKFTLEFVLREKLVKKNKAAKHLIIANMFSDVEKLRPNLDIGNCFILKKLAETHQLTNLTDVSKVVRNYLAKNFEKVVKIKEFLDMGKLDFVTLIQSPEMECSEIVKCEATVRWVKHDPEIRKKTFPTVFKMIKLDEFLLDYLKETARTELLVKEFEECNDMMMNELFSRVATAKAATINLTPITTDPFSTQQGEGRRSRRQRRRGGRGHRTEEEDESSSTEDESSSAEDESSVEERTGRGGRARGRGRGIISSTQQQQRLQACAYTAGPTRVDNFSSLPTTATASEPTPIAVSVSRIGAFKQLTFPTGTAATTVEETPVQQKIESQTIYSTLHRAKKIVQETVTGASPLSTTATAFATKPIPVSVIRIGAFGLPIFLTSTAATTVKETPVQQKIESQTIYSTLCRAKKIVQETVTGASPLSTTATALATKPIPVSVSCIGAFNWLTFPTSTAATTVEETPVQQKIQSQTIYSTLKGTLVVKKKARGWTGSLCYVRNPATAMKCVWCETSNPTAPKAAQSRNRGDRGSPDRTHYGYDEWYQD